MNTFYGFAVYWTFVTLCITTVLSQDGPLPPRINIPGAIPLGAIPVPVRAPQFRNPVPSGPALVRIRRPPQPKQQDQQHLNAIPTLQRSLDEAKPVTEEPEEEISPSFLPHIHQQPQTQALHQSRDQFLETQAILPRFNPQDRPKPIQREQPEHFEREPSREQLFSFVPDRQPVIAESPPKQTYRRPAFREPRPQFEQEREIQQPVRRVQQEYIRPRTSGEHNQEKEKKPVAQILRKYREENEDGSITWGFENDDGSYKEEIIGIDCVTRGRYGYVDPDGMKREYTYETGIQCDPNKKRFRR